MVSDKDLELLDQYVGNRLNGAEKAAFEQQLSANAELRSELKLQQSIANGLRSARAAELKQLLNNVPVSSLPSEGTSMLAQVGLWAVVAAVVGAGVYFFFFNTSDTTEQSLTQTQTTEQAPATQPQADQPKANEQVPAAEDSQPQKSKTIAPKLAQTEEEKEAERKALDVFDPSAENDNNAATDLDEGSSRATNKASIAVETDATNKKYTFHYQFKEGKLFLYGSFDKNLYEIMEFFADNKRTMFLFYQNNYYLLNEDDEKVKSLDPIKDAELLKKLKEYRTKGH